jgi:hypothetical protein
MSRNWIGYSLWMIVGLTIITPSLAQAQGQHRLTSMEGNVEVWRVNESPNRINYQPISLGEPLHLEDYLRLPRGASATIICSNAKVWEVPGNQIWRIGQECPDTSKFEPWRIDLPADIVPRTRNGAGTR